MAFEKLGFRGIGANEETEYQRLCRIHREYFCVKCGMDIICGEGGGFTVYFPPDNPTAILAYTHIDCDEPKLKLRRIFTEVNILAAERGDDFEFYDA